MTRNIRADLANYSQQSVRDISVSRLEELYAPIVAQRKAQDEENEREFNLNIPQIEHVKRLLAQQLEQMANEENAHLPVTSTFSALQVVKQAKVSENDIGVRALETMLNNMWRKDRESSISAASYTSLVDHFKKNYPRSAVCEVLEKIGESGYMTLECSKLAEIASEIHSQEDYENAILSNCLQANTPSCKKARQFILALVNGDDETYQNYEDRPQYGEPGYSEAWERAREREKKEWADDPEVEEDVDPTVKKYEDLYKELREKKQRGDKIGNTRPFERTADKHPGDVRFDIRVEPEDEHPEGNASAIDEDTDNEVLNWIKEQREMGNEWAWCQVQVVASWSDDEGNEYRGESSWLGGCSYESEEAFVNDGGEGYYSDLKDEAFDDLMKNVENSEFGQKTMNWTSKTAQSDEAPEEEFDSEWGKYDSPLAKDLWEKSMESFQDDQTGSVDENGAWYALFNEEKAILWTDSQGFIYAKQFDDEAELNSVWEKLVEETSYNEEDESDE